MDMICGATFYPMNGEYVSPCHKETGHDGEHEGHCLGSRAVWTGIVGATYEEDAYRPDSHNDDPLPPRKAPMSSDPMTTNEGPYTVTHITKTVKHIIGNGKTISVTDPDYDEDCGPLPVTPSSQWCDLLNHAHAAGRASRDAEVEELTKRLAEKDEVLHDSDSMHTTYEGMIDCRTNG